MKIEIRNNWKDVRKDIGHIRLFDIHYNYSFRGIYSLLVDISILNFSIRVYRF